MLNPPQIKFDLLKIVHANSSVKDVLVVRKESKVLDRTLDMF